MVLTHTTNHTYAHPFSAVTLAYFLRYTSPKLNPFATHVLSTDTISSHVDPVTGRLHTTRIHLKKSRMPGAVFKLLPASITGSLGGVTTNSPVDSTSSTGDKASYILETSVVDMREGWMSTQSQNLNFTGVLSVVERQRYAIPSQGSVNNIPSTTDVATTVVFRSRLGEKLRAGRKAAGSALTSQVQSAGQDGWFSGLMGGWGARKIQQTIENLASKKTKDQLGKSREGMMVVLERLRSVGIYSVIEMTRRDQQVVV